MAPIKDTKPVMSIRFMLTLDGKSITVNSVGGISASTTAAETDRFAKGGRYQVKNPGNQEPTALNITRQLDEDKTLWDWIDKLAGGSVDYANGSLVLYSLNDAGEEVARYNFVDAWPSKVSISGFDAAGTDTLQEECTLVVHDFERVK